MRTKFTAGFSGAVTVAVLAALLQSLGVPARAADASGSQAVFSYTGTPQYWTVPAGVTSIQIDAVGAQGGGEYGGFGGRIVAILPVTPGEKLQVMVGGTGGPEGEGPPNGGFNGGGSSMCCNWGTGGGGASDVRIGAGALENRVVVAGGGGGGGGGGPIVGMGGSAGDLEAQAGAASKSGIADCQNGGGGGTQSAGGTNGGGWSSDGALGQGGEGGPWGAGSGGGGYYGGGGGGEADCGHGGGGAGSSYATPSATSASFTKGYGLGHGRITITYPPRAVSTPSTSTKTFGYTGAAQVWRVPAGVTSVQVDASGAQGGGGFPGSGGRVTARLTVTPGQLIAVLVGGRGGPEGDGPPNGGFNGGGNSECCNWGTGGGGASDLRLGGWMLEDRVLVAAGGGGGVDSEPPAGGGGGGGLEGQAGGWTGCHGGGGGGTQTGGGANGGSWASDGALGQGGTGGAWGAGSGGGGYYGGGGGGGEHTGECERGGSGAGGGGSSYSGPQATDITHFPGGSETADGSVSVTTSQGPPDGGGDGEEELNLDYVALGDSYSSGQGNPRFMVGTNTASNRCHRSRRHSYPQILRRENTFSSYKFWACSGAKIEHFYDGQNSTQQRQLNNLSSATDLVTLSIGGNDAEFAKVLSHCVTSAVTGPCRSRHRDLGQKIKALKWRLAHLYTVITEETRPDTRIQVLGYPKLFSNGNFQRKICPYFSRGERVWMQKNVDLMNSTIRDAVDLSRERWLSGKGIHQRIRFISIRSTFEGHEACTRDAWIYPYKGEAVGSAEGGHREYSFHPNETGQLAIANRLMEMRVP